MIVIKLTSMITSLQNPLVKQIRKLHQTKGRREQHRFLVEGTHLIETAIDAKCSLETVCYTQDWQNRYPSLWENLHKQAIRMELVSLDVLKSLATTVHPDGVIAILARFESPTRQNERLGLGLMIERLQDPGNLGTIIRTSVATGVENIWLSQDSVDIDHPKVLRSSAGAWFHVQCQVSNDLAGVIRKVQGSGVQVIASLPQAKTIYWELDLKKPSLILLGNEGAGLSTDLVDLADQTVTIPLCQGIESLNVAIAAAVILYEVTRQRTLELT